jgi:isopenicillin-N epimerase
MVRMKMNLNAGTLSPTPGPVLEAVTRLRQMQSDQPSDFLWRQTPRLLKRSRNALAKFLKVKPDDLLLLPNVTFAMNLAVTALRLPRGSEILMTDHEYGAMVYCWQRWAKERGWKLRQFKLPYTTEDPGEIVAAVAKAIRPATRVLFFSHVTSTTGLVLPAAELCRLARRRGLISIVDGAHAVGMVPVNLTSRGSDIPVATGRGKNAVPTTIDSAIGADFYGANCHKWLMAPLGCGFLHVAGSKFKKQMEPLVTSWGWAGKDWQNNMEFHGCTDRTPQMVLPEVLAFRKSLGGETAIRCHARQLTEYARLKIPLLPVTPRSEAMIAFELPAWHPLVTKNILWERFGIECPVTKANKKHFLRVSVAWFTTTREINALANALRKL